jgi:hydrogenase nickel incorporation protein HypA/HybF
MHELGVTQAILDTALRYAQQGGAHKIKALSLRVGALSGVVADSVHFYFDFVSKDTIAEGAQLRIEVVPPRARCQACGA